ncbi:MAG: VOC family protein, partial [Terriglobales bacterium]
MTFQKPAGSPSITPFLWFNDNAEEAVEFYLRVFPNLRRSRDLRNPGAAPGPKGGIVTIEFSLNGQPFVALNDGPGFPFTQAVSFFVSCRDVARHFLPWSLPLVARSAGFDSRQGPP